MHNCFFVRFSNVIDYLIKKGNVFTLIILFTFLT
nr:hypothetical protein BAR15_120382 [Bartonella sp. AR 15-3]